MALSAGFRLGVYEILAKLGEGGMGEVYRARDTRLKRDVAIKVLPDLFAHDPGRLARFEREAELLATLNHPNIAGIYGFEEAGPVSGIVLELVEGPTLSGRIAHGAIPLDEALTIARQVTDALDAAHQKGIVHRDLKPANIKLTPGGQVKVLDFGLAKAMEPVTAPGSAPGLSISPTMVSPATHAGIIVGTAAYMSPEQARGKTVDQRADIWAFGCVLYEMLTGRSPFARGETVSDAIAEILTREPDWSALPERTPASVRRLLRRCLEKDATRRLNHIGDARLELDDTDSETNVATADVGRRSRLRAMIPWSIAILGLAVAASGIFSRPKQAAGASPVTRLEVHLPDDLELYTTSRTLALSPDASRLAFVGVRSGARRVYLRRLDQFDAAPLQGTDNASTCFFSADGKSIGFVTSSGVLKTVSLTDGVVTTVIDGVRFQDGSAWSEDGSLIYASGNALWRVMRPGGTPQRLTTLDSARNESTLAWPIVLPGGRTLLFAVASNDRWRVDALDLTTAARHTVIESGTLPLYTSAGELVFFRDGRLLAAPFDAAAVEMTGPAVPLLDNMPALTAGIPLVDISLSGTVVYSPTIALSSLVWVSRHGDEMPVNNDQRSYTNPRISADGQRIIVQAGDLWIQDLARGTFSRLTTGEILANAFPIWMPDGRVMYRGPTGLRIQGTNGPGDGVQVIPGTTDLDYPGVVAPDADTLIFGRSTEATSFNILALSLRQPSKTWAILETPAYESGQRLSPDGRWLMYVSNETGRNEIYITSYPASAGRLQVSTQGGTQPNWNPNGKEVFYRIGDKMMAVDVATTPALKLSAPKQLFEVRYAYGAGITIANYDVSRDGQRFIMVKPQSGAGRLNVVMNWFAERSRARGTN